MIQDVLKAVVQYRHLSREEAARAMSAIMSGEVTPTLMSAFLVALHMKGETVEEITGFAETMRKFATRVETSRHPLVDTCGTGGDHSGTFNISTTAAFVVAGSGVAVAKHGNRSASSKCGSADVLEHLGVKIDAAPEKVGQCIDEVGIGFLFARSLHGAMKHVAPVRSELLMRTVFNILGPLTNPAGADGQVMGVFDANLVEPLANVLNQLGVRHAFVVSGSDGLDELTLCGHSIVAEVADGAVRMFTLTPEELGLTPSATDTLVGGDAAQNAEILRAVLEGEQGPRRDIVLLNAAPAIVAGQQAANLAEGLEQARKSIDSGAALEKLQELKRLSHDS